MGSGGRWQVTEVRWRGRDARVGRDIFYSCLWRIADYLNVAVCQAVRMAVATGGLSPVVDYLRAAIPPRSSLVGPLAASPWPGSLPLSFVL